MIVALIAQMTGIFVSNDLAVVGELEFVVVPMFSTFVVGPVR